MFLSSKWPDEALESTLKLAPGLDFVADFLRTSIEHCIHGIEDNSVLQECDESVVQ